MPNHKEQNASLTIRLARQKNSWTDTPQPPFSFPIYYVSRYKAINSSEFTTAEKRGGTPRILLTVRCCYLVSFRTRSSSSPFSPSPRVAFHYLPCSILFSRSTVRDDERNERNKNEAEGRKSEKNRQRRSQDMTIIFYLVKERLELYSKSFYRHSWKTSERLVS